MTSAPTSPAGTQKYVDAAHALTGRTPPPGSIVVLATRHHKPVYPVTVNSPALFDDLAAFMRPCLGHSIDAIAIIHYRHTTTPVLDDSHLAVFTGAGIPVLDIINVEKT